ncbi:conjugal transfer mating pair stabilization protein TraN [Edwardsiella tarda]|uniref:conjugal transfer mating pair stabilization protein TraN n=1 Tax=Edwardsiella tarda TaxID=636 RepID=UPI00351C2623
MNVQCIAYKAMATILAVTTSFLPVHGYANSDISQVGRDAQNLGNSMAESFRSSSGSVQNGQITLPTIKDGKFDMGGQESFNVNELFPGTSSANNNAGGFFPDGKKPSVESLKGLYDSSPNMDSQGNDAQGSLWSDANSGSPSIAGAAYKVLLDAANRSRPDFSNDPILNTSKDIYGNMDLIAGGFGDCSSDTIIKDSTLNAHVPKYERCQRVMDQSADCEVLHDYDASVVKHYDGPYNIKSCGPDCTELWIGRIGDNYWSGWCSVYEEFTRVIVSNPDAIISATLEYAKWDDYMQVWVGKSGSETKVWQGPNNNFPPETGGSCELNTSWERNPNVDVTRYFKEVSPGDVVTFKIRVSVAGEGFGRIKIRFDPSKTVTKDTWTPQSCLNSAKGVVDGFAKGTIECIDMPNVSSDKCTEINGIRICENHLAESPLPDISRFCKKVHVKADWDYYQGQMDCWVDPQGEKHCPINNGGNLNSCKKYEDNPKCGFISSECIDGAKGQSGTCYVFKDTYDCGSDVKVPNVEKETEYNCGGPIRCMGDDCLDLSKTQSTDFAKAAALLNAAQFMTQDMVCTGQDGNSKPTGDENVVCSAFGGKSGECKIAVGGVSDCCEKPSNISLADYLNLIMAVPKLDGSIMSLSTGNPIKGAYQVIRDPVMQGWTEVTKPFTSYVENLSGSVDAITKPMTEFVDQFIDQIKGKIKDVMVDILKSTGQDAAMTNTAATAASKQAAEQLMQTATTWLSTAMTIYTVYVVSMVMIQMIWKCEEDEFTMNAQRALDNCTYVGSYCKTKILGQCIEEREAYCCFNSPLSRIIQEQVRPQLGMTFGSAKSPQCDGIPLEDIGKINWDKVDLTEWLGILQQHGKFPNPQNINIESITGSGNDFNIDGTRKNSQERAIERLDGLDVDGIRKKVTDNMDINTGAKNSLGKMTK